MSDRAGQKLGNYRLTKLLGEGGYAEVYLGEHIHLGTQAAIKVLHALNSSTSNTVSLNVSTPVSSKQKRSSVWHTPFIILLGLFFILPVVGIVIAFNIPQPYGSINPNAGLDHAVELALSVILLLVAIAALWFVHNGAAIIILLLTAMFTLGAVFAFLVQTLNDIHQQLPYTFNQEVLNLISTSSLAAASLMSFLWLMRPYMLIDRIILLAVFGVAGICALLQYAGVDSDVAKHIYLLILLIFLIQGVLIAVQTERVRVRRI